MLLADQSGADGTAGLGSKHLTLPPHANAHQKGFVAKWHSARAGLGLQGQEGLPRGHLASDPFFPYVFP